MKAIELEKAYDPKSFEDRIYEAWLAKGLFQPAGRPGKKPYVIVIPPPNVTGVLHMGHGLQYSLQDILIRFHRMLGEPTLWVPGTDHAGIATQHVVEKKLRERGIDRRELGRENFVEETWKVTNEHHDIIKKQLEKIGSSCDWSRERFTFDKGLSLAVREVFVTLYERGLVYKGKYLVNWCTSCGRPSPMTRSSTRTSPGPCTTSAIASNRARRPDGKDYIEIATTRPETLLGRYGGRRHPGDERYQALVGGSARLPLTRPPHPDHRRCLRGPRIRYGTGQDHPAHDPNDFEVGKRHELRRSTSSTPTGP